MIFRVFHEIKKSRIIIFRALRFIIWALNKAISFTVGFVSRKRLFSTQAQIGLLTQSKKGFSTQLFSTEFSDWGVHLDLPDEKLRQKSFTPVF